MRKKKKRERPTDRGMRPSEVFNWEASWGFVPWARSHHQCMGGEILYSPLYPFPFLGMCPPRSQIPSVFGGFARAAAAEHKVESE